LGGSYFVETLTKRMQQEARQYFDRIEQLGGMIDAIEAGFFRREIADAAFQYQREVDAKRKLIVGVNAFVEPEEKPIETLVIDDAVEKEQVAQLRAVKGRRDAGEVRRLLDRVRRPTPTGEDLSPTFAAAR